MTSVGTTSGRPRLAKLAVLGPQPLSHRHGGRVEADPLLKAGGVYVQVITSTGIGQDFLVLEQNSNPDKTRK